MNVSRRRLCMTLPVVALALACTTGIVGTEPDLAGVQVADGMPDAVPAEATPKPAPKPKPKPKPAQPATAPEPAKPEPPLAAPEPPKPLSADEIVPILGKKVLGPAGEDLGRVVNVLVDEAGRTRAAVIDFGGFLGVGSRKIAVDWNALHFEPNDKSGKITLDLTQNQVKAAPEYQEGKPVVVLGASGATQPLPDYR